MLKNQKDKKPEKKKKHFVFMQMAKFIKYRNFHIMFSYNKKNSKKYLTVHF